MGTESGPPRASQGGVYQYPASGRDTGTLRPVTEEAFAPRFPTPADPSGERAESATAWVVGLGSFAAVLLIGVGAMVNQNHANATSLTAASLPNALTPTPLPLLPKTVPVVPANSGPVAIAPPVVTHAAPVALAAPMAVAPPVGVAPPGVAAPVPVAAPVAGEKASTGTVTAGAPARKIKKAPPQHHVTLQPTRATHGAAPLVPAARAPRSPPREDAGTPSVPGPSGTPTDPNATKQAQEMLIKAMAERPLN